MPTAVPAPLEVAMGPTQPRRRGGQLLAQVVGRRAASLRSRRLPEHSVQSLVLVNLAILLLHVKGLSLLAFAFAATAPVTLGVLRRPQRGLLLIAVLAPLDGLLVILPVPGIFSAWKQVVVVLVFVATFVCPLDARADRPSGRPAWVPGLVALLALGVASAALVGGLQALIGLRLTFFYTLLAWAAWRCPMNRVERDRFVTILLVTGFVAAGFGLAQQALGPAALVSLGYEYNEHIRTSDGVLRSIGTFQQPFGLGFYMMLVVLVGLPVVLSQPQRIRTRLFFLSVPVYALALFASFVRAAWIGLAVGLIYLGYRRFPSLLSLLPLVVVGLAFAPADLGAAAFSPRSMEQRAVAWGENVDQIVNHPLGLGIGSSGSAIDKMGPRRTTAGFVPDNYYVKTVFDLGVVGLWLLVLVLVAVFASLKGLTRVLTGVDAALGMGVAATVVAAAVASTAATYFEMFPMDLFFWLLVGVAESMRRTQASVTVQDRSPAPA